VKSSLAFAALVLVISAIVAWLAWDGLVALPFVSAALFGFAWAMARIRLRSVLHRDWLVRAMVRETLAQGGRSVQVESLVTALGSRDVIEAWNAERLREEENLAARYANGDSSDF
jgi:hypothetical protein